MNEPHYSDDNVTVHAGDCLDVLKALADNSVDAVVTDPPYLLGFMGRAWDTKAAHEHLAWHSAWAAECLRVLKPGGHMLAFGGTRTWHRLACAVEDAGFEIRDSIAWLYGSGFPKSLAVDKAIDKRPGVTQHPAFAAHLAERRTAAGLSRADVSERVVGTRSGACWNWEHHQFPEAKWWPTLRGLLDMDGARWDAVIAEADRERIGTRTTGIGTGRGATPIMGDSDNRDITAPATDAAKQWQGWGTALKPAFEPIVVARKPLSGTVAANVQAYGTGALNVDGCRVATTDDLNGGGYSPGANTGSFLLNGCQSREELEQLAAIDGKTPNGRSARATLANADKKAKRMGEFINPAGRWPANVVLDGVMADELDRQSGTLTSGSRKPGEYGLMGYGNRGTRRVAPQSMPAVGGDSGGASRFFPTFKSEDTQHEHHRPNRRDYSDDSVGASNAQHLPLDGAGVFRYTAKAPGTERPTADGIAHPTVKPLELMRWLIRLVTPPGGVVLDPFAGSGTTGEAAIHEHKRAILIEREPSYLPLIVARLSKPMEVGFDFEGIA